MPLNPNWGDDGAENKCLFGNANHVFGALGLSCDGFAMRVVVDLQAMLGRSELDVSIDDPLPLKHVTVFEVNNFAENLFLGICFRVF